jgi:hypothetical protein
MLLDGGDNAGEISFGGDVSLDRYDFSMFLKNQSFLSDIIHHEDNPCEGLGTGKGE